MSDLLTFDANKNKQMVVPKMILSIIERGVNLDFSKFSIRGHQAFELGIVYELY